MKNSKLTLNKSTIANLSSEEMLNAKGGAWGNWSSNVGCCGSATAPSNTTKKSSRKECCNCDKAVAADVIGTEG